jgi:hypothetical protein
MIWVILAAFVGEALQQPLLLWAFTHQLCSHWFRLVARLER